MKAILAINVLGAIAAAVFAFVGPLFTDLEVRGQFVELDRAGVINTDALEKLRFLTKDMEHRNTVPRYIAGPAMEQARLNAVFMLLLAATNVVVAIVAMRLGAGRVKRADA